MYKFALIGYPLSHSMSAVIHNAALKDLGLDGNYEILETKPEDLIDKIKYLKNNDYNGFNITIPHKVPMIMFLDKYDSNVNIAGSVNTVKIDEQIGLSGYNTDIYGFKTAIPEQDRLALRGEKVAVLGLGGACRGAVVALSEMGVKKINFYVRNILNAQNALQTIRENFKDIDFEVYQMSSMNDLSDVKMLVNTTPVGMLNHSADLMPITENKLSSLDKSAIVYDIIYNPIKTKLILNARKLGYKTVTGVDMFIYQAQKAFEIWTNITPKFEVMKLALYDELL
ncbi:shikimate dehydrogenase [bacterium]|nr:shikimate dehydrogenase [bacterium]